ncbi:hypothetical protein TNCV_4351911 [Trichonephila clavipes]|nr:hypothetical protein TNCV_4351911 [Trichonephila clavipes]
MKSIHDRSSVRDVEEPHHAGTTWSGATTEKPEIRQEVPAELVARRSDMPYHPKDWAERTYKVASKDATLPPPHQGGLKAWAN